MMIATAFGPTLLVCLGLAIGGDSAGQVTPADEEAYRAASEAAGRDADAQVALALWCEANGRPNRARHHLALAVLIDPDHEGARGLMGQIRRGESWRRPSDAFPGPDRDAGHAALREEYEGRRSRMDQTAQAHWDLGLWCERNGLADEALAHFTAVTRLDPRREAAWKRIGYSKRNGRWVTDAQLAAERAEAEARTAAEAEWRPRLERWARMLKDPARRDEAIAGLATVDHPLLVPAAWSTLVTGRDADQPAAVQVLGQIDARDASRALATLAVFTEHAEVRRIATETLKNRDVREWADLLIGMIRRPIQYSVRPVAGPGSQGELFVEGKRYNYRRLYAAPPPPVVPMMPGDQLVIGSDGLPAVHRYSAYSFSVPGNAPGFIDPGFNPHSPERRALVDRLANAGVDPQVVGRISETITREVTPEVRDLREGRPEGGRSTERFTEGFGIRTLEIPVGQAMLEAQRAAAVVEEHLRRDVLAIETVNAPIRLLNRRVVPILEEVTGARNGEEPDAWRAWWARQAGLRQVLPRPADGTSTFTDVVTAQPRPVATKAFDNLMSVTQREITTISPFIPGVDCLGEGTPVHTAEGLRPIEEIQFGDLVLSQDSRSGALAFRPVVASYRNPPASTFEIQFGGETIVSSDFHRFWVAGRGWVMAKDLRVGDSVRLLHGQSPIDAIRKGEDRPVFNLEVAENRSFLIGEGGALVHDFSIPSPTIDPFDAVPDLASLSAKADPTSGE